MKKIITNGEKPAWVDLYEKIQKKEFEEPQESEADRFIIFDGDNFEQILKNLKNKQNKLDKYKISDIMYLVA